MNSIKLINNSFSDGFIKLNKAYFYQSSNSPNQIQTLPSKHKEPGFLDYLFNKLDTVGIIFLVDLVYQLANIVLTTRRKNVDFGFWAGSVAGLFRGVFIRWLTVFASLRLASSTSFELSYLFANPAEAKPKVEGLLSFLFGAFIDLLIGNKVMLYLFDRMLEPRYKKFLVPIARLCGYKGN